MKKYFQVKLNLNVEFRDSLQFLFASLDQPAALLAKVGRKYFQNLYIVIKDVYHEADVELLKQNKVFCYDYLDSIERLDKPALPLQNAFFYKWSAHRQTMRTLSTYKKIFTA